MHAVEPEPDGTGWNGRIADENNFAALASKAQQSIHGRQMGFEAVMHDAPDIA
jgi:hypothetical protein